MVSVTKECMPYDLMHESLQIPLLPHCPSRGSHPTQKARTPCTCSSCIGFFTRFLSLDDMVPIGTHAPEL